MGIFQPCDIRGIVNQQWDAEDARRIGRALGTMMRVRREQTIYVAGDFRATTLELKRALVDGLLNSGIDVCDLGQLPTPVAYFAARDAACGNVAIVTASHNPAHYNGIKFMLAHQPAIPELVEELQQCLSAPATAPHVGQLQSRSPLPAYEAWLAREFPFGSSSDPTATRLPVVCDTMYGAFSGIAARVLRRSGVEVAALRDEAADDFHGIDPNPADGANLQALVREVVRRGAGLGIATDGDGDRVIFVDSSGRIAHPEEIAVLLIQQQYGLCTLVYDLKCASIVPRAVSALGGQPVMQPSGHGFIKSAMLCHNAATGIEVSGHHFHACLGGGDDGLFTALLVLRLLRKTGRPLADLIDTQAWPAVSPDIRIRFDGDRQKILQSIVASCGGEVSRLDGVRAQYGTSQWALARASITEPAMTFRFEGRDTSDMRAVARQFLAAVPSFQQQVMEKLDE